MTRKYREIKSNHDQTTEEMAIKEASIKSLQEQVELNSLLSREYDVLSLRIAEEHEQNQQLSFAVSQKTSIICGLNDKLNDLDRINAGQGAQIQELSVQVGNLKSTLIHYHSEKAAMASRNQELVQTIAGLQEELTEAIPEINRLTLRVSELERENRLLKPK